MGVSDVGNDDGLWDVAGSMGSIGSLLGGVDADGWKVAAALLAKNIGGGINFIAVSETLGVSPAVVAAGLTIDNIGALFYFPAVSYLANLNPSSSFSELCSTAELFFL